MSPPKTGNPERYVRHGRSSADGQASVIQLLAPRPGERILDLGCGDGALTAALVKLGCRVLGVDTSAEQIRAARARGVNARVVDAHLLPFHGQFDAVFSNAALHWMRRPDEVIAGVFRALKAGGRFVAQCGAAGNVARIESALCAALGRRGVSAEPITPWYFPTADEYRRKLVTHGFSVDVMDVFPRPTVLPGDLAGWLEALAEGHLASLGPKERWEVIHEVQEALRDELCRADGTWTADYVRLRLKAQKPLDGAGTVHAGRPTRGFRVRQPDP